MDVVVAVDVVVAGGGSFDTPFSIDYRGKIRLWLEVFLIGQILGALWNSSTWFFSSRALFFSHILQAMGMMDEKSFLFIMSIVKAIVLVHCSRFCGDIGKCFAYLGGKSRVHLGR